MFYDILNEVKTHLTDRLTTAKTIKIGLEDGISAKYTPFVRIVPIEDEMTDSYSLTIRLNIVIGTLQQHDLEKTYQQHLQFKDEIINALDALVLQNGGACVFVGSAYDSDEVENYKISLIEVEIQGVQIWQ